MLDTSEVSEMYSTDVMLLIGPLRLLSFLWYNGV